MEKQQIKIQIVLTPESFHPNKFYDDILEQVKTKEMTCDMDQGYIDQIFRVVDVSDLKLTDDGCCHAQVIIECMMFKPSIGKSVEVRVVMVSEHGIFSEFGKNINRFLVPASQLDEEYEFVNGVFRHKINKDITIAKDDIIQVVISNFRFTNKCFCCIASLESVITRSILDRNFL